MFFRRRRFYLNQYYDKAIYYDRKTHEVLEAPKSKLLDTEKSNKMNRHIPLLVVLFIASGSGISSFFSLFLQGTYSMIAFWSVILIWIAEFAFITILVERALYRNINRAQVTTQTVSLFTICDSEDLKEKNLSEKEKRNNTFLFNALLFTIPAVGFYYIYDFIFHFNSFLGQQIGGEIFKIMFAGLLLGVAFVIYNQNNIPSILDITEKFESGKLSVVCRDDDNPELYLEVSVGPDRAIVTKELHK
ncbi:hypothetical protein [Streptococcus sanguinis]|nr:hypothetical protein [Streptococcus sanguinis]